MKTRYFFGLLSAILIIVALSLPDLRAGALTVTAGSAVSNVITDTTSYTFTITTATGVTAGQKLKITFNAAYTSLALLNGLSATGDFAGTISVAGQVVTVTTSGIVAAGAGKTVILPSKIVNPAAATYQVVGNTYTAADVLIDGPSAAGGDITTEDIVDAGNLQMTNDQKGRYTNMNFELDNTPAGTPLIVGDYVEVTFPAGFDISALNGKSTLGATPNYVGSIAVTGQVARVTLTAVATPAANRKLNFPYYILNTQSIGSHVIKIRTYSAAGTILDGGNQTVTIVAQTNIGTFIKTVPAGWVYTAADSIRGQVNRDNDISLRVTTHTAMAVTKSLRLTFPAGFTVTGLNLTNPVAGTFNVGETISVTGRVLTLPTTVLTGVVAAGIVNLTTVADLITLPKKAGNYVVKVETIIPDSNNVVIDSGSVTFTVLDHAGIVLNIDANPRVNSTALNQAASYTFKVNLDQAIPAGGRVNITFPVTFVDAVPAGQSSTGDIVGVITQPVGLTFRITTLAGVGPGIKTFTIPASVGIKNPAANEISQISMQTTTSGAVALDGGSGALDIIFDLVITQASYLPNIVTNNTLSFTTTVTINAGEFVQVSFPYGYNVSGLSGKSATGSFSGAISVTNDSTIIVTTASQVTGGARTLILPSYILNPGTAGSYRITMETQNSESVRQENFEEYVTILSAPTGQLEITSIANGSPTVSATTNYTLTLRPYVTVPRNGFLEVVFPAGFSGFSNYRNLTISSGDFLGVITVVDSNSATPTTLRLKLNTAVAAGTGKTFVLPSGIVNPSTAGSYTITARTLDTLYAVIEVAGSKSVTINPDVSLFRMISMTPSSQVAGASNVTYTITFKTIQTLAFANPDSIQVIFPKTFGLSSAALSLSSHFPGTGSSLNPPIVRGDTMLSFRVVTADIPTGAAGDSIVLIITGIRNPLKSGVSNTIKVRTINQLNALKEGGLILSSSLTYSYTNTVSAQFQLDSTTSDLEGHYFRFIFKGAYQSGFTGGEGWTLWMHTDPDLAAVDSSNGGIRIQAGLTTGTGSTSLVNVSISADVRQLSESVTYYLYATLPANAPYGDSTKVAVSSTGFTIRHQPIIDIVAQPIQPSSATYPTGVSLNSGTSSPTNTFNIQWKAVDYNSGTLDVKLFISTIDSIKKSDIVTSGSTISSLTRATRIATDATLTKNTIAYTLNVTSPTIITKGNYYVYVVIFDGTTANLARSTAQLKVSHSPAITLDNPGTTGAVADTINTSSRLAVPIYWGTTGAYDIDDASPSILIYLSTQSGRTATQLSAGTYPTTINLTSSGSISLNQALRNSTDNGLYTLRLDQLTQGVSLPLKNIDYYVYAVINDGSSDATVSIAATRLRFKYTPRFSFKASFGGSAAKVAKSALGDDRIKLRKGDIFRINFNSNSLDQEQQIRLVACTVPNLDYDNFDPSRGAVAYAFGTGSWVINSTDGTKGVGPTDPNVVTLTTSDSAYNWSTGSMNSIVDGNYYIYAFVSNDSLPHDWTNDSTEVFQSTGTVNLSGATGVGTPPSFSIYLSPNIAAVTENEIITFDIKVNTAGASANEISFFLSIPDSLFSVVDDNNDKRPFFYTGTNFLNDVTAMKDTFYTHAADTSTYLDFRKFRVAGGVTATNGLVARFKVKAKGNLLIRGIDRNIAFVQNETSGRVTQMSDNGVSLPLLLPSPALKIRTLPLARISGNVPLEGRTNFSREITLELREIGWYTGIINTLYSNSNDRNPGVLGVQVTTNSEGYYELMNVPSGTYNLVAKSRNYLTGQARNISVVAGDLMAGANPVWGDEGELGGSHNYLELRGGDVSSGNQSGTADNVVDSDDIQWIQNNFEKDTTSVGPGDHGDIDHNGRIDFRDLLITAGNVGEEGVAPTFNKQGAGDNRNAVMKLVGIPEMVDAGSEFEVSVMVENVNDLKGYLFTLQYDKDMIKISENKNSIIEGDFLYSGDPSARSVFFTKDDRKGLIFVNSLIGRPQVARGNGEIIKIRFSALVDGVHPDIVLSDVQLANSANEITSIGVVVDVPAEFALLQNYPNPFNPQTRIRFQLPEASNVVLKVYNILGQEVRTLVNGKLTAGYHSMLWDGKNDAGARIASGIYIYRIKAGKFQAVKKMVLLK